MFRWPIKLPLVYLLREFQIKFHFLYVRSQNYVLEKAQTLKVKNTKVTIRMRKQLLLRVMS